MYLTVVGKYRIIKSIKIMLALIVPTLIIQLAFNSMLITLLVIILNLEMALVLYFDTRKQFLKNFLGNGLVLLIASAVTYYIAKSPILLVSVILVMSFLSYYFLRFSTVVNATAIKFATVDVLVMSYKTEYLKGASLNILLVGGLGLILYFGIVYFVFPEKDILHLKHARERLLKSYRYYIGKIEILLMYRDSSNLSYQNHKKLFTKHYKEFIVSMKGIKNVYLNDKDAINKISELVAFHHSIIKILTLVESSLVHVIDKRLGTPDIYKFSLKILKAYNRFLETGRQEEFLTLDELFKELTLKIEKYYEKKNQEILLQFLFSMKALIRVKNDIYKTLIGGTHEGDN